MDALSSIWSNIGGFLTNSPAGGWSGGPAWGNIGKTLGVAGLADQFINNWMINRSQNAYLNQQLKYQRNPQLMQNEITGLTRPLDANLVASVSNQVQGNLANQGLAESPAIQASILAQALAPYSQQNQQLAAEEWYRLHGLPVQFPQQANMTGLWRYLLGGNQQPQPAPYYQPQGPSLDALIGSPADYGAGSAGAGDLFNFGLQPGATAA